MIYAIGFYVKETVESFIKGWFMRSRDQISFQMCEILNVVPDSDETTLGY